LFSGAGNLALRWRFKSDTSVQYDGFALDDIHIWEEPPVTIPPDPVTMVAPLLGATGIDPRAVILDWVAAGTGGAAQNYDLYVSNDVGNMTGQHHWTIGAPTSQYAPFLTGGVVLDYNTTWYWLVQPSNTAGAVPIGSCSVWSFTTKPQLAASVTALNYGIDMPGSVHTINVTLTNLGATPLTWTSLFASPEMAYSTDMPTIPGLGTTIVPVTFTAPMTLGAYTGFFEFNETAPSNGVIHLPVTATIANILQIGNGIVEGQSLPVEPFYTYTYSQSIYLQSEIGLSDQLITSVAYYYDGYSAWSEPNINIYLGHTALSSFATTASYVPLADLTLSSQVHIPYLLWRAGLLLVWPPRLPTIMSITWLLP